MEEEAGMRRREGIITLEVGWLAMPTWHLKKLKESKQKVKEDCTVSSICAVNNFIWFEAFTVDRWVGFIVIVASMFAYFWCIGLGLPAWLLLYPWLNAEQQRLMRQRVVRLSSERRNITRDGNHVWHLIGFNWSYLNLNQKQPHLHFFPMHQSNWYAHPNDLLDRLMTPPTFNMHKSSFTVYTVCMFSRIAQAP